MRVVLALVAVALVAGVAPSTAAASDEVPLSLKFNVAPEEHAENVVVQEGSPVSQEVLQALASESLQEAEPVAWGQGPLDTDSHHPERSVEAQSALDRVVSKLVDSAGGDGAWKNEASSSPQLRGSKGTTASATHSTSPGSTDSTGTDTGTGGTNTGTNTGTGTDGTDTTSTDTDTDTDTDDTDTDTDGTDTDTDTDGTDTDTDAKSADSTGTGSD
jgi:hypothetical protein